MIPDHLTITILGSGTSTGVPVIGCDCPVCTSPLPENSRTRCSALISFGSHNILIDTSTDLRQQALREGLRRIDAVLFTHTHADHIHGIDDLRTFTPPNGKAIPIFGPPRTMASIRNRFSYIFEPPAEPGYRPSLETFAVAETFCLFGLNVEPLPLHHGKDWACGYRIADFAYLTDCSGIPPHTLDRLSNLELLVIDALRFKPHHTHFNIDQALDIVQQLAPKRTLLTHLSHDVDHFRHGADLPPTTEFAFDGQTIYLPFGPTALERLESIAESV